MITFRTVSLYTPLGFSAICVSSCNTPAVTDGRFVRIIAHWLVNVIFSGFEVVFAGVSSSFSLPSSVSELSFDLEEVSFEMLSSSISLEWSRTISISGMIDFNVVKNISIFSSVMGS